MQFFVKSKLMCELNCRIDILNALNSKYAKQSEEKKKILSNKHKFSCQNESSFFNAFNSCVMTSIYMLIEFLRTDNK